MPKGETTFSESRLIECHKSLALETRQTLTLEYQHSILTKIVLLLRQLNHQETIPKYYISSAKLFQNVNPRRLCDSLDPQD